MKSGSITNRFLRSSSETRFITNAVKYIYYRYYIYILQQAEQNWLSDVLHHSILRYNFLTAVQSPKCECLEHHLERLEHFLNSSTPTRIIGRLQETALHTIKSGKHKTHYCMAVRQNTLPCYWPNRERVLPWKFHPSLPSWAYKVRAG